MPDISLASAVRTAAARLAAAGVPDPLVDAELLAGHLLGLRRGEVQAAIIRGDALSGEIESALDAVVARRAAREPLQHITGVAPFRHLELAVGPGVFVPRPETETVVQYAIDALLGSALPAPIAVDLGTGSGAIALAMATEVPHARVFAAELSPDAYPWAVRNTAGVENLTLVNDDLAHAFGELDGTASVVISNPPYVPDEAIPRDPEVRLFDPSMALYGGADGLDLVRVLSVRAGELLHPGGLLVIEHGELQGEEIRSILTRDGWRAAATHRDLTLRDRATTALRP
ncbi:peptide chain release factor N(5)-glutamine methyltransferase [Microbacterium foliorum]|uniref:Release factor glutamine methyltransferase n=1 Tax=Microbacterium foliorum TaxID=104336 RepID=A0A0F0KC71_9MICO|nr:peptide chain release factor N(5)-glutamine methyltransferase [Microbacterium foliorum]AXL11842.1 peptide chain release factor N(5)-glutamine methyltransferase [Microbacterium foliorum]KJL18014.1 Release factor glutamine methyltransferase [Microbacterium foliorum]CAH0124380.1 Release factor glutamine methyltransferase [Microbacterium foliorum]CAH0129915.1 Release factor glutamine methyltransferase [Microbacterium foliorum]